MGQAIIQANLASGPFLGAGGGLDSLGQGGGSSLWLPVKPSPLKVIRRCARRYLGKQGGVQGVKGGAQESVHSLQMKENAERD